MMRKAVTIILVILSMMILSACGQEKADSANVYSVYYVSKSETKVELHEYEMQSDSAKEQLDELIDALSAVPEKLEYKAPLSMGFELLEISQQDGKVLLDMSAAYKELPATTEVLVRAAIVRTLTQLPNIDYVGITVEGEWLYDNIGKKVGWMNAELFINNDGKEINTYELIKTKLYFANETGDGLIATYREKHYSTNISVERFVVEELIAGPEGQAEGVYATINPATKIINVMTKDGICYVNLDSAFLTVAENVSTEIAVYSIVNSLVELSNVNKVQVLINGEIPSVFSSSMYERNLDYVVEPEYLR